MFSTFYEQVGSGKKMAIFSNKSRKDGDGESEAKRKRADFFSSVQRPDHLLPLHSLLSVSVKPDELFSLS